MHRKQRLVFAASLGALAWASTHLLAACGDDSGAADARIVYEASHPALDALLAAPQVDDGLQAVHLIEPVDGEMLDANTPVTFRWRVGPGAARLQTPVVPRSSMLAGLSEVVEPPLELSLSLMQSLVSPLRTAHAHGPPISGRGYYLVAQDEEGVSRYRLWTTALEHTPGDIDWKILAEASGTVRITVVNALFHDDVVVQGGGPWAGNVTTVRF